METNVFTVGIGGAAGDGVKKAGIRIGQFLSDKGYEVYLSFEYPSLIKGGHNFARLSFSREKIWADHQELDLLIVSNEESVEIHKKELKKNSKIISKIPFSEIAENPEVIFDKKIEKIGKEKLFTDGNTAFAKGLMEAGLQFYFAYPMTPATSILHYLASKQTKEGLKVIQPENEISVINMALGAIYAGKRAAIGSATGGFALMHEAFSFAGIAELPIVIAVSQRQAPATGVPTRSSQSDLFSVIHAGHGEFPRIVLTPGDAEEAFEMGVRALDLAWKFRVPMIVLLDKILSEHMMTIPTHEAVGEPTENVGFEKLEKENNKIPGTPNMIVRVNSYEHDEEGFTIDKTEDIKKMVEKRFQKAEKIKKEMRDKESIKIYGDKKSKNIIIFWGSTKSAILEASKYFKKSAKLVQVLSVEPFPADTIFREVGGSSMWGSKKLICIEGNHDGQLASLIRQKTGIEIKNKILKYDSMPFDPEELTKEINKVL